MKQGSSRLFPFLLSAGLYLLLVGVLALKISALTHGAQWYLLDDPYIHLAIAKNLLLHGVYGISQWEPSLASSSIAWPFLLAGWGKLGLLSASLPLWLNIAFSLLLLWSSDLLLRHNGLAARWRAVVLCLVVLGFPLPAATFMGLEHIGFAWLVITFLLRLQQVLEDATLEDRGWLLAIGALLTCFRFEGGFLIAAAACVLLWQRQIALAILLGIAGLLPIVCFAHFSQHLGGMAVPNSLIMKTHIAGNPLLAHFAFLTVHKFFFFRGGLAGLLFVLLLWSFAETQYGRALRLTVAAFLIAALIHLLMASVATARYDSYMIAAALLLGAVLYQKQRPMPVAVALVVLVLLPVVLYRGIWLLRTVPVAAVSIYQQQYEAGRFFARYYDGSGVFANDIGVLAYLADVHCLDIAGLGTNEVARAIREDRFNQQVFEHLARERGIVVGFAYEDQALPTLLPANWQKVASWTEPHPTGAGAAEATIAFYATSPEQAAVLEQHLKEFAPELPQAVTVQYVAP
ncbi:MAG: hypothetical protein PW735_08875 [Acidobacteriaceae bacterium]|nr:hypothetical protein [Acidobacteriaceae bacterium]